MDNCSAHKIEGNEFQCIELVFLPPNTTLSVQLLNQGIIKNFKHYYHRQMLQKIMLTIDADENSMVMEVPLDAVNFMSAALNNVSADTIQNCFFHCLTLAVPDEPFLGFPLDEVPA